MKTRNTKEFLNGTALFAAVDRIKELEEKLKADGRRCPMCGKMHNGSHTLCPACESDPHN